MKPIIAITDFSPVSLNAVNYAADMALSVQSDLLLMHVCNLPMAFSEVPYPAEGLNEIVKEAEKNLAELEKELLQKTTGKIKIDTQVKTGSLISETEDYCNAKKPYAVIMGTQGSSAIERVFLGSTTVGLLKNLSWPLIIVPPQAKFSGIKKVGFACDLETVDDTTPFAELRYFVEDLHAELHIVHVNPENKKHYSVETMIESRVLQNMLQGLHPSFHFLNGTDIEEGLSKFAETNQLDLLVVVPKKHNIIEQLFHKSQSKKLALHTQVPVMAVHE